MATDWIRRWHKFDELDSTSTHMARLWRSGEISTSDTPILVTTTHQTAGRGRGDHKWYSDSGSLIFTLGLRPADHSLSLASIIPVGLLTALSMISAMESIWPSLAGHLGVRWPNDIECDNGKLGGILPECIISDSTEMLLLIGVGVNIQTDLASGTEDARRIGTSLANLISPYDQTSDPQQKLLITFLNDFQNRLGQLADHSKQWIQQARPYDRLLNQPIRAKQGENIFTGMGRGWDADGRLLIEQPSGQIVPISSGQILRH